MEWLTNLELLAIIVLLWTMRPTDEPEPEPPPVPEPVPIAAPPPAVQNRVRVLLRPGTGAESLVCHLPAGHPDLNAYLDTPGYYLEHPDGTIEAGRQ